MKKAINPNGTIDFTFEDGVAPLTFDPQHPKVRQTNRDYAMLHGFAQRLGDAAALSATLPDGTKRVVTDAMRRAEIVTLVAHYESGGDWNMRAAARATPENPSVRAYADKLGITYDAALVKIAQAAIDALSTPTE